LFGPWLVDSGTPSDDAVTSIRMTQVAVAVIQRRPFVPAIIIPPDGGGEVNPGDNPAPDASICNDAPLATWAEIELADSTIWRHAKVAINLGDPKEPRAVTFGTVTRSLSNAQGEAVGSTMQPTLDDTDGVLRAQEDTDSLVGSRYTQYVSSKRRLRIDPDDKTRVFDGVITDVDPTSSRLLSLTVTDYLTVLLDEFNKRTFPQRVFNLDDFPQMGNDPSDPTNPGNPTMLGKPVPILYGALSDEEAETPIGVVPWTFTQRVPFASRGGQLWDEYIAASHDIGAWQSHFVASGGGLSTGTPYPSRVQITAASGLVEVAWPGTSWWAAEFGSARTITRNGRTYLAMYMFGPRSDLSRSGQVPHVSNLWGIDENGDGTGRVIDDLYRQFLHLLINFVFGNYQSGAWLAPPTVGSSPGLYSRIDTTTFEALKTLRDSQIAGGVLGAFILGHGGEALTFGQLLALFARNGHFDYGPNRHGQLIASAIDTGAPINRVLGPPATVFEASYKAKRQRDLVRNIVNYHVARRYVPPLAGGTPAEGELLPKTTTQVNPDWLVSVEGLDAPRDAPSVTKYGERPEDVDFELIRDEDTAAAIAQMILDENATPPVHVAFTESECGVDTDLGQVDTLAHFDALSNDPRALRCQVHQLDLDTFAVTKTNREQPFGSST
jgi:hypothetical protein